MKLDLKELLAKITGQTEFKTLLWSNDSAAAIPPQTISLDLSNYEQIEVEFCVTNTSTDTRIYAKCPVGGKGLGQWWFVNQAVGSGYNAINAVAREFSASTTGVTFQNGQMFYNGGSYFNWDGRCVPTRIYGIKYVGGGYCLTVFSRLSAILHRTCLEVM